MKRDVVLAVALSLSHFLTIKECLFLYSSLDSSDTLRLLSITDISGLINRKPKTTQWSGAAVVQDAEKAVLLCERLGIVPLLYFDDDYPELLHEIADPPFVLFCRGSRTCFTTPMVSVVGTRRLTPNGYKAAYDFAAAAVADGVCVISGLAYGTDKAAHEGAIVAGGKTIAVLPSGIDTVVPRSHVRLAQKIIETGGCLVSEYVPGVGAEPWRYVQRNRIIAGLSSATVVIQAPPGSGALLTADFALSYDRDLLFHQQCFDQHAVAISDMVRQQLHVRVAHGEKKGYKLEKVPEKYVYDGAPVIQDYADYIRCLKEMPGSRVSTIADAQLQLL